MSEPAPLQPTAAAGSALLAGEHLLLPGVVGAPPAVVAEGGRCAAPMFSPQRDLIILPGRNVINFEEP
jgi:hypothetical protein